MDEVMTFDEMYRDFEKENIQAEDLERELANQGNE